LRYVYSCVRFSFCHSCRSDERCRDMACRVTCQCDFSNETCVFCCCGWQRITEVAGVVVSFDPKPIPVTISLPNVSGVLICVLSHPAGLMSSLLHVTAGRMEWCRCSH
jgi:hypothetical protein